MNPRPTDVSPDSRGALLLFGASAAGTAAADAVVAADGSGQFRTVQAAVDAAPQLVSPAPAWTIRIRPGTYREQVYVQREKRASGWWGTDPARTVITYDLNARMPGRDGKPIGTFRTPTVWIDADDFEIDNLTLANSAGAVGQALALRVDGDRVTFLHCRFLGWQDTILGNRGRHYYEDCLITGAVDFIFGAATEFYRILPDSLPGQRLHHGRLDAVQPAVRLRLRPMPHLRGEPGRSYLPGTPLAGVREHHLPRHRDERRRAAGRLGQLAADRSGRRPPATRNAPAPGPARNRRRPGALGPAADRRPKPAAITVERVLGGPDGWRPAADIARPRARLSAGRAARARKARGSPPKSRSGRENPPRPSGPTG